MATPTTEPLAPLDLSFLADWDFVNGAYADAAAYAAYAADAAAYAAYAAAAAARRLAKRLQYLDAAIEGVLSIKE